MPMSKRSENKDIRDTSEFSIASEKACRMSIDGRVMNEVLLCNDSACDVSRISGSACPILFDHDMSRPIGKAKNVFFRDGKIYIEAKRALHGEAVDVWKNWDADVLTEVSIGYTVSKYRFEGDTAFAEKWAIHEVSIVSCPADDTVGKRRSINTTDNQKGEEMEPEETEKKEQGDVEINLNVETAHDDSESTAHEAESVSIEAEKVKEIDDMKTDDHDDAEDDEILHDDTEEEKSKKEAEEKESECRKILELGERMNVRDLAISAMARGISFNVFKDEIKQQEQKPQQQKLKTKGQKMPKKIDIMGDFKRCIEAMSQEGRVDHLNGNSFLEISAMAQEKAGEKVRSNSFVIPHNFRELAQEYIQTRANDTSIVSVGGGVGGSDIVPIEVLSQWVEKLYLKDVLPEAGAQQLYSNGPTLRMPRDNGVLTFINGVAPNYGQNDADSAPSPYAPDVEYVEFNPIQYTSQIPISEKMLLQGVDSLMAYFMGNLLRANFANLGALAKNKLMTAITANKVGTWAVADTPEAALFRTMKVTVANKNVIPLSPAFVGAPGILENANLTPAFTNATFPLRDPTTGTILNTKVLSSPQFGVDGTVVYGDFSQCAYCNFGSGIRIMVDPYTRSAEGVYNLNALQLVDFEVLRPDAFAWANNNA